METGRFGAVGSPVLDGILIGRSIAVIVPFMVGPAISALAATGAFVPRDAGSAGSNGTTIFVQWDDVGSERRDLAPPP
jgi:hypothetical protein